MSATKSAFVPVVDESALESYKSGDKSAKAKIRAALESAMRDGLDTGDFQTATDARVTLLACTESSAPTVEAVPVPITLANRAATLMRAAAMILLGEVVPDGIDAEGIDYATLPQGEADVESAAKIASAKITRSGDRHDIGEVIVRAFESVNVGTVLTVAEIVRTGSTEAYRPSPGAVSNKITSGHPMIEKVSADAEGPLRARRV